MKYSVYVDGNEVNDFYLSEQQAMTLAKQYIDDGYDVVEIGTPLEPLTADGFVQAVQL